MSASDCVVDASVGIKLFINSPLSDTVHDIFAQLTNELPAHIYVPDLFYIEIANALWKYVRWQGMPMEQAQGHLLQLERLHLYATSTSILVVDALAQAADYNITVYDACYLVLAHRLSLPLITADAKFAKRITGDYPIQLLT